MHIIHRFNIEYKIIEENENIENLSFMEPRVLKIMNLEITDDSNGCLQDIHWYGGDLGYFPTYSIGAFIAAQLAKIRNNISNYDALLESGNLKDITNGLNPIFIVAEAFIKLILA